MAQVPFWDCWHRYHDYKGFLKLTELFLPGLGVGVLEAAKPIILEFLIGEGFYSALGFLLAVLLGE